MKALKIAALVLVVTLLLLYLGVSALLYVKQRDMIYPLGVVSASEPVSRPGVEHWTHPIDAAGAEVYAYFLPAHTSAERAGLVVYFHGNGNTIEDMLPTAKRYQQMGYHVLLPEYRGYNRAAGAPSEEAITQDALVFLSRALERPDVDADDLVFHGFSLGGGVACSVARARAPKKLILQSTFTGVNHIAQAMGMLPWLVKDPYDSLDFVGTFEGPLLVVHGIQDELLTFKFGQLLAQAAPRAHLLPHDGTHNTHPEAHRMWAAIRRLLDQGKLPDER